MIRSLQGSLKLGREELESRQDKLRDTRSQVIEARARVGVDGNFLDNLEDRAAKETDDYIEAIEQRAQHKRFLSQLGTQHDKSRLDLTQTQASVELISQRMEGIRSDLAAALSEQTQLREQLREELREQVWTVRKHCACACLF